MEPFFHVLQHGAGEPAWNMAVDEVLLLECADIGAPVLRFYGWTEPSATFGYFQKYAEIERTTELRPLLRRPTGGGLVPHASDWTYSLAFPPGHEWFATAATESYRRIHEWLRKTFAVFGCSTALAPCCSKPVQGQCFVGYEQHDLLAGGQKIAGAAQRRNRHGLLIQGSVQPLPAFGFTRTSWQNAMVPLAVEFHLGQGAPFELSCEQSRLAERLTIEKYSQASYNRKR